MSSEGSVTNWIEELKTGNRDQIESLWKRYFSQIVRLARRQIQTGSRSVTDEEDIAISVFESFCRAAERGRFPDLADRDTLWRLLVRMTARKVIDKRRSESRLRRGGKPLETDSALPGSAKEDNREMMDSVIGNEPTPEFVSMMAEQMNLLILSLQDPQLQELAIGKMEGYTNDEMAEKLDCSLRTVERRLRRIRETIKQELS